MQKYFKYFYQECKKNLKKEYKAFIQKINASKLKEWHEILFLKIQNLSCTVLNFLIIIVALILLYIITTVIEFSKLSTPLIQKTITSIGDIIKNNIITIITLFFIIWIVPPLAENIFNEIEKIALSPNTKGATEILLTWGFYRPGNCLIHKDNANKKIKKGHIFIIKGFETTAIKGMVVKILNEIFELEEWNESFLVNPWDKEEKQILKSDDTTRKRNADLEEIYEDIKEQKEELQEETDEVNDIKKSLEEEREELKNASDQEDRRYRRDQIDEYQKDLKEHKYKSHEINEEIHKLKRSKLKIENKIKKEKNLLRSKLGYLLVQKNNDTERLFQKLYIPELKDYHILECN